MADTIVRTIAEVAVQIGGSTHLVSVVDNGGVEEGQIRIERNQNNVLFLTFSEWVALVQAVNAAAQRINARRETKVPAQQEG